MTGTPVSTRTAPSRRFENYVLTRVVDQSAGLTAFKDSNFTQLNGPNDYTGFNIGQGFCDDGYSFVTPIGFDFQLDGITYKQFVANSNGWMALVDPTLGTFTPRDVLSASYSSIDPITSGTIFTNSSSINPAIGNGSWQNAAIKPSFASNAVIIAPWFDDLRNTPNTTAQLLLSPFSFGATKANNVAKGIEPRPTQLDQVAYGVSYLNDRQSTKGRRLIIRWNCLSNYVAPSTTLKFEAILYENGAIEFRYASRAFLKLQGSSLEGATIGVFMPNGTNRFRDFAIGLGYRDDARQEYIYGGYIYTASYVDSETPSQEDFPATASYTINLQPAHYWPGLINGGSIFTFSPPVKRRKVLPRLEQRKHDARINHPTVARTGDSRLGIGQSTFDDRRSPQYLQNSGTIVNYPTTMPRFFGGTGIGTLERQNLFSGDMLVTGNIVKSAIDPFLNEDPFTSIAAFNETQNYEQSSTSSFYLTGSSISEVGAGFDQPLKSKTQIKLQFPVDIAVQLPGATSSIYYYNRANKSWNVPQNSSYTLANGATTHPAGQPGGDWMDPTWNPNKGFEWFAEDARGFGPIGNVRVSGSHQQSGSFDQTDGNFGPIIAYNSTTATNALKRFYPKSIANNNEYQPTNDETFTLPITAPFLIEKAVIEIPFSMGPGWFLDQTQTRWPVPATSTSDFGGPAMTVALHRVVQLSENSSTPARRDLILTGTITHQADNIKSVVLTQTPDITGSLDPGLFQLRNVGFLSYADRASAVVSPIKYSTDPTSVINYFTGSVKIECEATVAHGLILDFQQDIQGAAGSIQSLLTTPRLTLQLFLGLTSIQNPIPFGRGGTGFEQSGRSILGKEFATFQNLSDPSGLTVPNPFYVASGSIPSNITSAQIALAQSSGTIANTTIPLVGHFKSPYLVMPGDKLVLSLSKTRPAIFSRVLSWFSGTFPSTGHDVQLTAGQINITLYGSQIKEGAEFHDTLNQPLGSDMVHEIIGAEPVIDQFESSYRDEYTGSYSDNVMLGNLLTSKIVGGQFNFVQGVRDRKLSKLNARNAPSLTSHVADVLINPYKGYRLQPWFERAGGVRLSQFSTDSERFWDSMLPSFAGCLQANGVGIFVQSLASVNNAGFRDMPGVPDGLLPSIGQVWLDSTVNGGGLFDKVSDRCWTHSYPYEPRYNGVNRLLNTSNGFIANFLLDPSVILGVMTPTPVQGLFPLMPSPKTVSSSIVYPGNAVQTISINYHSADALVGSTVNGLIVTSSAPVDDVARTLFGFGDRNTLHFTDNNTGFVVPYKAGSTTQQGTVHYADFRSFDDVNVNNANQQFYSPFSFSPIIRGWKYGIYNGLPTFSKNYWRRGKFGQFRDMLEQRLFTKYYESPENDPTDPNFQQGVKDAVVKVKFLTPSGQLTNPESTWSSNLDFECTSSLPYFDGVSTNRPPIIVSTLNRSIVNLSADNNGNVIL